MQIDIKHKDEQEVQFTWYNAVRVKVAEGYLQVVRAREGKENLVVGSYSLADFDFEILNDD